MRLGPIPLLAYAFFRGVWRRNWPLVLPASLSVFYRNLSTLKTRSPASFLEKSPAYATSSRLATLNFSSQIHRLLLILALAFSVMRRFFEDRRRQQQVKSELQSAARCSKSWFRTKSLRFQAMRSPASMVRLPKSAEIAFKSCLWRKAGPGGDRGCKRQGHEGRDDCLSGRGPLRTVAAIPNSPQRFWKSWMNGSTDAWRAAL